MKKDSWEQVRLERWAAIWRSYNILDGLREHPCFEYGNPVLFLSRTAAERWIKDTHGYIAGRSDLKKAPHGWKMPKAERVIVTIKRLRSAEKAKKVKS